MPLEMVISSLPLALRMPLSLDEQLRCMTAESGLELRSVRFGLVTSAHRSVGLPMAVGFGFVAGGDLG